MKTINAEARPDSRLADYLDDRRNNGINTAAVKRQSSRQVRHRLGAELRKQLPQHFTEAMEMAYLQRQGNMPKPQTHTSATIIAFPHRPAHGQRVVQVIRKIKSDPFVRKQIQVVLLAA